MQHKIREAGTLTYVLEIDASADDLALDVRQAVRKKRSVSNLKGFRPGRVPHHWIRRMFRRELEEEVCKTIVEEAFDDLVAQTGEYDLVGRPRTISHSYELDGDLHVELEFVTKPVIELKEFEEQVLEVKQVNVTDDLVHSVSERLRRNNVVMRPLQEEERIGDKGLGDHDAVLCKATEIDPVTGVVLVGATGANMEVQFGESDYADDPEYEALCAALTGSCLGDEVVVRFTESGAAGLVETRTQERAYKAKVIDAERRHVPEIDGDFVQRVSRGQVASAEEWPVALRKLVEHMVDAWNAKGVDEAIIARIVEIQDVPVPDGLIRQSLEDYGSADRSRQRDDHPDRDIYKKHLAWHYIYQQMFKDDMFEWPVEPVPADDSIEGTELETVRLLERIFGMESRHSERPTRMRCALDFLESQFDVVQVEDTSVEELEEYFAPAADRVWHELREATSE